MSSPKSRLLEAGCHKISDFAPTSSRDMLDGIDIWEERHETQARFRPDRPSVVAALG